MFRFSFGTALILLLSGLLAPPAGAAPNTFNTALPVAQDEFIWREQLILRERSSAGLPDREVSVAAVANVLGYGINSRWAVFGAVPYFLDKTLDVKTPTGPISRSTEGIGDATVFARYTLYKHDFTGGTFRIAPVAGITIPTGDHQDADGLGELPRPLQVGDGAWDGFGGLVVTYQTLDYQLDTQLVYRNNGRHDGFAAGDEISLDASLQYRIWPRSLTSGTPAFVYALLESNLVHRQRNEVFDRRDADSGGTQWLIAPGLQYVGRRWIFEGTVQLPVSSDPNGAAIEDDTVLRLGFRRNF